MIIHCCVVIACFMFLNSSRNERIVYVHDGGSLNIQ